MTNFPDPKHYVIVYNRSWWNIIVSLPLFTWFKYACIIGLLFLNAVFQRSAFLNLLTLKHCGFLLLKSIKEPYLVYLNSVVVYWHFSFRYYGQLCCILRLVRNDDDSCIIVIITGIAVFFIVPKDQKVGDEETQVHTTKEAIIGVGRVTKLPVIWIAGINVFCIYGAFVAAGTYFARFLQSGYGTSAVAAAVFAIVVIALRMLPLVSSVLVEKIFDSTSHFMRTMQIILVFLLVAISIIFLPTIQTSLYMLMATRLIKHLLI